MHKCFKHTEPPCTKYPEALCYPRYKSNDNVDSIQVP